MSQTWNQLRRAALAFAFVGTLGFGATQALAAPDQARFRSCPWSPSGPQIDDNCNYSCTQQGFDFGYCENGQCTCIDFGRR